MGVLPRAIECWSLKTSFNDGILNLPFHRKVCRSGRTKRHMSNHEIPGDAGSSRNHDSARLHVTGEADYVDDLPVPGLTLYAAFGVSQYANARVTKLDLEGVRQSPGVVSVVTAHDIPGKTSLASSRRMSPSLFDVLSVRTAVICVAAQSFQQARAAVECARVEYEPLVPVLTVEQAWLMIHLSCHRSAFPGETPTSAGICYPPPGRTPEGRRSGTLLFRISGVPGNSQR